MDRTACSSPATEYVGTCLPRGVVVMSIVSSVAESAAKLHIPDRRPTHDALIAATAQVHGLVVATRNEADFASMRVPLVTPGVTSP
ncbi:PIN domain-containing protein [Frankia sp. AgKG'84/4]|uniref:PIN domain-containing protein n=1 Tax=Frankia sp. AgKG'84/4 TaxID=573490 RepID=UPI0027E5904E|nr:PIN domain-containing protein [Frankia sp. AgKG'84/4]